MCSSDLSSSLLEASCWDNIVDFRWHRNNVPSPHWYLLPAERRLIELPLNLIQAGWKIAVNASGNKNENKDENENENRIPTDMIIKIDNTNEIQKDKVVIDSFISRENEEKKEEDDEDEEL